MNVLAGHLHGTMEFIPQGDFSKDRTQPIPDNVVVRIIYTDGAEHKSLKDGKMTTEDALTGIMRARKIWDDKVKEGWSPHLASILGKRVK